MVKSRLRTLLSKIEGSGSGYIERRGKCIFDGRLFNRRYMQTTHRRNAVYRTVGVPGKNAGERRTVKSAKHALTAYRCRLKLTQTGTEAANASLFSPLLKRCPLLKPHTPPRNRVRKFEHLCVEHKPFSDGARTVQTVADYRNAKAVFIRACEP